jgi:hypothetical protein
MLNWLLLNTDLLPEDLAAIPANTGSVKLDAGASVDDPQAVH